MLFFFKIGQNNRDCGTFFTWFSAENGYRLLVIGYWGGGSNKVPTTFAGSGDNHDKLLN